MGGGLESRCVGRVYGADGAVRVALKTDYTHSVFYPVNFDEHYQSSKGLTTQKQIANGAGPSNIEVTAQQC